MKKKMTLVLLIMIFISIAAYHFYTVIGLKKKIRTLKYQEAISSSIFKGGDKNVELYKNLSNRAINLLDEEGLVELAKEDWKYSLLINGQEFKGEGLKIEGDFLEIILSEERNPESLLPMELLLKGQIPNYFHKHIEVESEISPEITNKDGEYSTEIHYNFSYLSHGDRIKIKLSNELRERLELKNRSYIIYIK